MACNVCWLSRKERKHERDVKVVLFEKEENRARVKQSRFVLWESVDRVVKILVVESVFNYCA